MDRKCGEERIEGAEKKKGANGGARGLGISADPPWGVIKSLCGGPRFRCSGDAKRVQGVYGSR